MKKVIGIAVGLAAAMLVANAALAAASVSGTVFYDTDGNGIQGVGEAGIGPVIVYADANNNAIRDDGEVAAISVGGTGEFTIGGLANGTYVLRVQATPTLNGMVATVPVTAAHSVTITSDQSVAGVNFGFRAIAGTDGTGGPGDPAEDSLPVTGQLPWLSLAAVLLPTAFGLRFRLF